jgi:antitoxin PrlF
MMSAAVTSKGQVTIPKPVRDQLGIEQGTRVDVRRNDRGEIVLSRADGRPAEPSRFAKLRGSLKTELSTDEIMAMLRDEL